MCFYTCLKDDLMAEVVLPDVLHVVHCNSCSDHFVSEAHRTVLKLEYIDQLVLFKLRNQDQDLKCERTGS